MNLGLSNRKVFITASSAGTGSAIAETFLQEGACVCINGRSADKLKTYYEELQRRYGMDKVLAICGDMSQKQDIEKARQYIIRQWKNVDILVGNLGTGKSISENRLAYEEWKHMLDYNLLGAVSLLDAFDRLLNNDVGSIVLISSLAAHDRIGAPPAYAAAKKGILALVKYMSDIYAERGIRINAISPGNIYYKGGRWEELMNLNHTSVQEYINRDVAMKRFGTTQEIANAAVFLASACSSFTTGSVLNVDGGQKRGY